MRSEHHLECAYPVLCGSFEGAAFPSDILGNGPFFRLGDEPKQKDWGMDIWMEDEMCVFF